MIDILAIIGAVFIFSIAVTIIIFIIQYIYDHICNLKYQHRYKHRFDKPPMATCFCRDCLHHSTETNQCYKFNWHTADNWFCWNAEPRDRQFENIAKEGKIIENIQITGTIIPSAEGENDRYYIELPDGYRLIYSNDGYEGRYNPSLNDII